MIEFSFGNITNHPMAGLSDLESCLLGEFAHRVVNDLSCASAAVRLARRRTPQSDPGEMLDQLARRLDALARIQRVLQAPVAGELVDLGDRLHALCQAMVAARYEDSNIALRLSVDNVVIDAGCGWRILMIVAELLVNAARHAFDPAGGVVMVELVGYADATVCRIRDNGRGRPAGPSERIGYGSSVIQMLVEAIDGDIQIVSSPAGTAIELTVPVAAIGQGGR